MRPLLLDAFCGAGGAAVGYHRAGFDVFGVDIAPQKNYPFDFIQADALTVLADVARRKNILGTPVEAIHASPPCQRYTALAKGNNANVEDYPDLIAPTRELLQASGLPYVIENVATAPLENPITLCGEMFGLGVLRHRKFESNVLLLQPPHPQHRGRVAGYRHGAWFQGPYFAVYGDGGGKGSVAEWQTAMGIDWTDVRKEIAEAIPPAMTQFIGSQLIEALETAA